MWGWGEAQVDALPAIWGNAVAKRDQPTQRAKRQVSDDSGRPVRAVQPKKRPQGQNLTPQALERAKRTFLQTLQETSNIAASCRAANVARKTVVEWRKKDTDFAESWDEAMEAGLDDLEQTARERAHDVSDLLLMFLLKANRPEKYRETIQHQASGEVRVVFTNDWRGVNAPTVE